MRGIKLAVLTATFIAQTHTQGRQPHLAVVSFCIILIDASYRLWQPLHISAYSVGSVLTSSRMCAFSYLMDSQPHTQLVALGSRL